MNPDTGPSFRGKSVTILPSSSKVCKMEAGQAKRLPAAPGMLLGYYVTCPDCNMKYIYGAEEVVENPLTITRKNNVCYSARCQGKPFRVVNGVYE